MNPNKVKESRHGRLQFLTQVFPTELRDINRRQSIYPKEYDGSYWSEFYLSDLQQIEKANKAFNEAQKKLRGLKGLRSLYHRVRLILSWKQDKQTFKAYASKCRDDFTQTVMELNKIKEGLKPSVRYGLVGLAFSGGGIRSATFNFGVLQALAENKFLKYVDYLSTVSGGGILVPA